MRKKGTFSVKNIVLIGMPGTGKSTVGVILAKRLGFGFLDCDILIAQQEGRTLTEIIDTDGQDRFLEIEGQVGANLHCEKTVIATGGSMVFSQAAMENLKRDSLTIWLETDLDELERRLAIVSCHDRGVAAPAGFGVSDIYLQREPLYRRYADYCVRCEQGIDRVVDQILQLIRSLPEA